MSDTIIGLFVSPADAARALVTLETLDVPAPDISLVAGENAGLQSLDHEHAIGRYTDEVRHGAVLVGVLCETAERRRLVLDVLRAHGVREISAGPSMEIAYAAKA